MIRQMVRLAVWLLGASFAPFEVIIGTGYVLAGLQGLLVDSTPSSVEQSMGQGFEYGWLALLIVGPLAVLVGDHLKNRYNGLILQLAGNAAIIFALTAYIAAILQAHSLLGGALFSVWVVGALSLVEWLIIARRYVKIRQINRLAAHMDRERKEGE